MQRRPAKRSDVIRSLIRMETWGRDRIAGEVSQAEQLLRNCERERNAAEQTLVTAQEDMRRFYDHGARLEMDGIDRARQYLLRVETRHRESELQAQKSKQVLDELRTQLEKQALHVRGLERVATKQGKRELLESERCAALVMDELVLLGRRHEGV